MKNFLKKLFGFDYLLSINIGENKMAKIAPNTDGGFTLYNDGKKVGDYSRRRDAVRGAKRRNLVAA